MDEDIQTVHITKALSSSTIVDLIDKYPDLAEITCAPSVYNRTSKKYIDVLSQLDIEVRKKYEWGAKSQSNGEEFDVLKLSNNGLKPKEISLKLNMSLNRVYYLLKKSGAVFDNRKRKYDYDEIYKLKNDGLSVKEISQKLDIPLRSVYYILNKK